MFFNQKGFGIPCKSCNANYTMIVMQGIDYIAIDRIEGHVTPMVRYPITVQCEPCKVALQTNVEVQKGTSPIEVEQEIYKGYQYIAESLNQR